MEGVLFQSHLARLRGDSPEKIITSSKRALSDLKENDRSNQAGIWINLGLAHIAKGEYDEAFQIMDEINKFGQSIEHPVFTAVAAFTMAIMLYAKGQLHQAERTCREALQNIGKFKIGVIGDTPIVSILNICQGAMLIEMDNLDAARKSLEELDKLRSLELWEIVVHGLITKIRLEMKDKKPLVELFTLADKIEQLEPKIQGAKTLSGALRIRILLAYSENIPEKLEAAVSCMNNLQLSLEGKRKGMQHASSREWRQMEQLSVVRLIIACARQRSNEQTKSDLHQAMVLLDRQLKKMELLGLKGRTIEIMMLKAMALQADGNMPEALVNIKRSLALAEPEGYIRLFVDEGDQLATLLRHPSVLRKFTDYSRRLLASYQEQIPDDMQSEKDLKIGLIENLTNREREVLSLIATGISYQEIGEKLFISIGTIKRHAYNIYGKLAVKNRTQAVNRAKELGLL